MKQWCKQGQQPACSNHRKPELQRGHSRSMIQDYAMLQSTPRLAELARFTKEIIELEEPSCTPRRETSRRPGLAKLTRLTEEIISGEANSDLYAEFGSLLQAPDSSYSNKSNPYTGECLGDQVGHRQLTTQGDQQGEHPP